jgi:hypothetical protein
MKVKEMIELLKEFDGETEITILDGFNAGGIPRRINFGPRLWNPKDPDQTFEGDERQDYSDLESPEGTPIIVMGYGCY